MNKISLKEIQVVYTSDFFDALAECDLKCYEIEPKNIVCAFPKQLSQQEKNLYTPIKDSFAVFVLNGFYKPELYEAFLAKLFEQYKKQFKKEIIKIKDKANRLRMIKYGVDRIREIQENADEELRSLRKTNKRNSGIELKNYGEFYTNIQGFNHPSNYNYQILRSYKDHFDYQFHRARVLAEIHQRYIEEVTRLIEAEAMIESSTDSTLKTISTTKELVFTRNGDIKEVDLYAKARKMRERLIKDEFIVANTKPIDFEKIFKGTTPHNKIRWYYKADMAHFVKKCLEMKLLFIPNSNVIWKVSSRYFADHDGNSFGKIRQNFKKISSVKSSQLNIAIAKFLNGENK